jgi:hypothetical protein
MSATDFGAVANPVIPFEPPVSYDAPTGLYSGERLLDLLESDNYRAEIAAARIAAEEPQRPPTGVIITVFDKFYTAVGEINDYISLQVMFPRNDVGTATIVLKGIEPLADHLIGCEKTTVPITIDIGEMRWTGRVFSCDDLMVDKVNMLTLQCKSDYAFLDHILCWPAPELPIQTQFPARALYIGPAITVIKTLIAEQALRLQSGLWEIVNTLGSGEIDWRAWFGRILQVRSVADFEHILGVPLVVVPTNPIFDTSKWVSINGRMDKISTLIKQMVTDLGLVVSCDLWLPGDPQPKGLYFDLDWPCIVVNVRDRMNLTGPTGTFFDGIIENAIDFQRSILGKVLAPFLNPGDEYAPQGINIAPIIGVDFVKPWALFTDSPRSGLREYHVVHKTPDAYTVVGGGKSPKWLDDLIDETLEWLIDAITILIGISGIPNNFLDGILDDVFFAFQEIENAGRRIEMGPYGWPEFFAQTGGSAFTADEWFALQGAMWDTRGYPMFTLKFEQLPYVLGKDIFVGQLVSFVRRGILYTDYVESVTFTDNRNQRMFVDMTVGNVLPVQNPVVKLQRKLVEFEEAFQVLTLSND